MWFLVPGTGGGGAEFVASEWANWLSAHGYEVSVVVTAKDARGRLVDEVALKRLSGGGFLRRAINLRRLVSRERPDTLIALMPHWNVLAMASMLGKKQGRPKIIVSGRNIESSLRSVQGLRFRVETWLAKLVYRNADAYVAISHPVAAEALSKYGLKPSRVWVVPNPATAKVLDRGRVAGLGKPESSDPSILRLLVPARIVAQKRPLLALEMAALLRDRDGIDVSVHFFGAGPLMDQVRARAAQMRVPTQFHGWDEAWFAHAVAGDVVVLPSLAEGFANVLVEAAAVGVPAVVSSRALGSADAILPGLTGYFARDDNASGFADAILRARNLKVTGIDSWLDYFGPRESGEALAHVIESLRR